MFKKIFIAFVVIVAVFCVVAAMQPSEFRVERSVSISAPPAPIFSQVVDFHNWVAWSPWEKLDPAMKRTYNGAPAGAGASYSWAGNSQVGVGTSTIVDVRPNEFIKIKLDFIKPFQATDFAEFIFKPDGNQTVVTWSMTGTKNFMFKAFGLIMNCDKMVGDQFEQGLAQLKSVVESSPKAISAP